MEVLNKLQIVSKKIAKNKTFQILILDCKPAKNSFQGKILGLTLTEWIRFESRYIPCVIVPYDEKSNIIEFAKNHIDKSFDYTIVLLSKTPLIQNSTLHNIMDYVEVKECKVCKLPVGYVIDNSDSINIDSIYSQNIDDFYLVESKVQYNHAHNILQDRINSFHIDNGVELVSPAKTYIEPFVDIDEGVVIYPNNTLKGKTVIGKNVILKENNVINNSKIGDNSCISSSVINDSVISKNVYISAFCEINNSIIGEDSLIQKGASINNFSVDRASKLAPNSVLGDTNDSNSGIR